MVPPVSDSTLNWWMELVYMVLEFFEMNEKKKRKGTIDKRSGFLFFFVKVGNITKRP